ncbi:hypothetical protein AVEN_66954-1 [Araneus ventricosus]|uniref:Threonyl/alanyl tRNA synthetase SAD domain-containing protein n=1 Tax=Araneus ventricosus TaxID=182803 RepID=A0A4Y2ULH8_ARAVE|nr:hypothetical protein AVEN_66954-1 [Araneus ventricosus]
MVFNHKKTITRCTTRRLGISVGDMLADHPSSDPATSGSGEMVMSPEFCGKIHLKVTSPIGRFIISSEEVASKETRRIVSLVDSEATNEKKLMHFKKKLKNLESAKNVATVQKYDRSQNIIDRKPR